MAGCADEFVSEKIDNCAVFKPCDANDAKLAFEKLIVTQPRTQFNENFRKKNHEQNGKQYNPT